MKMQLGIVLICYALASYCNGVEANSDAFNPDRFVGEASLQIGFGADCYLFWKGELINHLNAEFRCKQSSGDPIQIKKSTKSGHYLIYSSDKGFTWNGDPGNTKNGQFRRHTKGYDLWIKHQGNGMYAIGFSNCPLFWRGDQGNTKNAEFRCGTAISDTFWIKGDACSLSKLHILPSGHKAVAEGEEIVGMTSAASCQNVKGQLVLQRTREVTEEIGLEISKSNEVNWETSVSVAVTAGVNIFGNKAEVQVTAGLSVGGAITYGSSTTTSTSDTTSVASGSVLDWEGPGGALLMGLAKKYKFDKASVPARATITCKGGYSFQYSTSIKLRTQYYSHVFFRPFIGKFDKTKCTEDSARCIYNLEFLTYKSIVEAQQKFNQCIPSGTK